MKKLLPYILIISLGFFISCSKDDEAEEPQTIVTTAKADGELSLFSEGIRIAGLESTLSSGTYTVLAPIDSSFSALMADLGVGSVQGLSDVLGQAAFRNFMLNHVLAAEVKLENFETGYTSCEATNSKGHKLDLYVERQQTELSINGDAAILKIADIDAGNGIIHKVRGVLSPATITSLISVNPDFSSLYNAMLSASNFITITLNQENADYTLFAPDDAAFSAFFSGGNPYSSLNDLINAVGTNGLYDIISYHVIPLNLQAMELQTNSYSTLLSGASLQITKGTEGSITITDNENRTTSITITNITGINGTVHVINNLLLP